MKSYFYARGFCKRSLYHCCFDFPFFTFFTVIFVFCFTLPRVHFLILALWFLLILSFSSQATEAAAFLDYRYLVSGMGKPVLPYFLLFFASVCNIQKQTVSIHKKKYMKTLKISRNFMKG